MAFNFLGFFNRLDARARIIVLVLGVLGFIFLIYFGTRYFFGGGEAVGPTRVAGAPIGLTTIPGGEQTPAFRQAVEQASAQRAEQARMRGESAVPTIIRPTAQAGQPATAECTIICPEQAVNVKDSLEDWVRKGEIAPEISSALQVLAGRNVSPDEYAAALDQLVREGKLTPEQARTLLDKYRQQHTNALLQESAKTMDDMIKAGQLPLETANELLAAQKNKLTPNEYRALTQRLVRDGRISPETAQRLANQYTQQVAREVTNQSIVVLQKMAQAGEIIPEVANELVEIERRQVPLNEMSAALDKYVAAGKMTPAVSTKILDEYKRQKAAIGQSVQLAEQLREAVAAALQEVNDLVKAGKMPVDVAAQITSMVQNNVPSADFNAAIDKFVQQNKITPEIAVLKKQDFQKIKSIQGLQQSLSNLQANAASPTEYADALKKGVQAGILTPQQAAQLMRDYQAASQPQVTAPAGAALTPEFAALQERLQEAQAAQPTVTPEEFAVAKTEVTRAVEENRQGRIDALVSAMTNQANQLVNNTWVPPVMEHKEGIPPQKKECPPGEGGTAEEAAKKGKAEEELGIPLIKAGTILFGILDTAVNSDYPDTPVMVTIVDGPYKGARLLGKLTTASNVAGQLDRISLNFTLMNMEEWTRSKSITAFAIDPDTARTAIASHVNYHYLKRFGAIMATSFLQGYANAIATSGSTTTTSIFGTSTVHPELSPGQKFATALGQIGTNIGALTQNYINIPPTVRVDSGVSLGILFMADVT